MHTRLVALACLLVPTFAAAEPIDESPSVATHTQTEHHYAIAVNSPTAWIGGFAYAASGYAALTDHQVIRVNAAYYKTIEQNPGPLIAAMLITGDDIEDEAYRKGGMFDVGAGWMYFPRRLWSGPTLELGTLWRQRHTYESDEFATPEDKTLDTNKVAGRAMVGWSWDIRGRVFFSIAAGASYGYERGTEIDANTSYGSQMMTSTHDVSRWAPGFEWNSRLGTTF